MIKDLASKIAAASLLAPVDNNDTATASKYVDRQGFSGVTLLMHTGTWTGIDATNYVTAEVEESDDVTAASFTKVADADLIGGAQPGKVAANTMKTIGYIGNKRYVRVNLKATGSGVTVGLISISAVLGFPDLFGATPSTGTAS